MVVSYGGVVCCADSLRNLDLLSQEFGYGQTFPYTLMFVPPAGVPALSVPCFTTVGQVVANLVHTDGVEKTSVTDFTSVAFLEVGAFVCVGR